MATPQINMASPVDINYHFIKWQFSRSKNSRKKIYIKLSKLLSNGVPLVRALETIRDRKVTSAGSAKKALSKPDVFALNEWIVSLNNGNTLSTAVNGWVPDDETMIIEAGEQSGKIEEALMFVLKVVESKANIRKAVIGGLMYPIIAVLMGIGVSYIFGVTVVPIFTEISQGKIVWTGSAAFLVDFSAWVQEWIIWVIVSIIAIMVMFFYSLPRWDGRLRVVLDRYAPYSIYRVMQGSSWLIAYAAMVKSGMRLEAAIERLNRFSSPWLSNRLLSGLREMRGGYTLGEALRRTGYEFPDREIIDDLTVLSEISGIEESLRVLGEEWIEEAVKVISSRMKMVFAIGIALVGLLFIIMIGGMFEMQIQLSEGISQM